MNDINKEIKDRYRNNDEFYTKPEIAKQCYLKTLEVLNNLKVNIEDYHFIDSGAGSGTFYNLFPIGKRIGIEAEDSINPEIIKGEYLEWQPSDLTKKYFVIGNPPFGRRGNLALKYINHSYNFADVVAYILPPLFNSDGKGTPGKRIQGYQLAYSEILPHNSFEYPNGEEAKVNAIFQVWTKINTHLIKLKKQQTCDTFIKVYSLSQKTNVDFHDRCDIYLPSSSYGTKRVRWYETFAECPYGQGLGVVFLQKKDELLKLFKEHDWTKTAYASTHGVFHLRISSIQDVIINAGYIDEHNFIIPQKTCDNIIKIYSVSNGETSNQKRNVEMIGKCDIYLPSTCYSRMKAYHSFDELPNERGYGIVFLQKKAELLNFFCNHDWNGVAFLSTNSALNLRTSLIKEAVIQGGYYD